MSQFYDNGIRQTYRVAAASLATAANLLSLAGPSGKRGRIESAVALVTTGVTVAAATVRFGTDADDDAYGTLTVPISSADAIANTLVNGAVENIPADSLVRVDAGGEATAGAADLIITVVWF